MGVTSEAVSFLAQTLLALEDLLRDEDCSVVFANRGGDAKLRQLLARPHGGDWMDKAADVVALRASCTVPGRGFPARLVRTVWAGGEGGREGS